jgi:hypothetical protein
MYTHSPALFWPLPKSLETLLLSLSVTVGGGVLLLLLVAALSLVFFGSMVDGLGSFAIQKVTNAWCGEKQYGGAVWTARTTYMLRQKGRQVNGSERQIRQEGETA